MKEIIVSGNKTYIKQELDKLSYDIAGDPESRTATTLEMLRKVPLISIGMNDIIEVNGRKSYLVLLNGKPSSILGVDPTSFLNGLQAKIVNSIEVITTPASRYSQNGYTEVLNIITNTSVVNGVQATLRTGYSSLNKLNSSLVSEMKKGGLGINLYANQQYSKAPDFYTSYRVSRVNANITNIHQNGVLTRMYNSTTLLPEVSFEIDSLSLVVASFEYKTAPFNNYESLATSFVNNQSQLSKFTDITTDLVVEALTSSIYYQHQGKKNKARLFNIGYRFFLPKNVTNINIVEEGIGGGDTIIQNNKLETSEHTFQMDYVHPFKAIIIEAGIKEIFRKSNSQSSLINFNQISSTALMNDQAATILYNSYYWKARTWGIRSGLRYERTRIVSNNFFETNFNNVVPTLNFQLKIDKSLLVFNYDQQIERPSISYLNNFVNQSNAAYEFVGNPDLKPSISHQLELNYNINGKQFMRFTGYYNRTIRDIVAFTTNVNSDENVISYYNGGVKNDLGIKFGTNLKFFKKLNYSINVRTSYVDYIADVRNTNYQNRGIEFFTTNNLSYLFKNGLRIEGYFRLSNPYVQPQGRNFWWSDHSINVNKKFYKSAMNCTLSLENPLTGSRDRQNSISANSALIVSNVIERIRAVSFTLSYRLGNMKYQIKKNSKPIENNDLKTEKLN